MSDTSTERSSSTDGARTPSLLTSPDGPDLPSKDEDTLNNAYTGTIESSSPTIHAEPSPTWAAVGAIRVRATQATSQDLDLSSCLCLSGLKAGEAYPQSKIHILSSRCRLETKIIKHRRYPHQYTVRILLSPEDVPSQQIWYSRALTKEILEYVDRSKEAWNADWEVDSPFEPYLSPPDLESLFYIFNTLPSPRPSIDSFTDKFSRNAIEDILEYSVAGLRTSLYPYQQRSAAMMIQRETCLTKLPDPRAVVFRGPTGQQLFYDSNSGTLLLNRPLCEQPRGGILAETMGYGKTLICLTVILATRGHSSRNPVHEEGAERSAKPLPSTVATLAQTVATKIIHEAIPWKAEFHELAKRGHQYGNCVELLQSSFETYTEALQTYRTPERSGKRASKKVVRLSSTTLVIVPPNLLIQWQQEIEKHTEKSSLDVLVLDLACKYIPHSGHLALHDVVLLAKNRFDQEYRDHDLQSEGLPVSQTKYQSPLTDLRWLRVILDEGVGLSSTTTQTNAMAMLDRMYFDRRWMVSGTPSNSLRGVEVGLAANETVHKGLNEQSDVQITLDKRRKSELMDRENSDLEKLRIIATKFLKVQPWASASGSARPTWHRYLVPFDSKGHRKDVRGLRAVLEGMIVRHTIQDVEADLSLPPLYNKVVYLEPSFHDKLSINMFVMFLVSNAVLSERTGQDYMFHPKNRKGLEENVNNLRCSSFHWTGITRPEVEECIQNNEKYLNKEAKTISASDHALLLDAIQVGKQAINHAVWLAFSRLHEMGVYVKGFPEHAAEAWAIDRTPSVTLLGTTFATQAQTYVAEHARDVDPAEGLPGAGIKVTQAASRWAQEQADKPAKRGAAKSRYMEQLQGGMKLSKRKRTKKGGQQEEQQQGHGQDNPAVTYPLPSDSPLHQSQILGFSSAKLTYLIDQLLIHHQSTTTSWKTIIFYDHIPISNWIAHALDLLSLPYRRYARAQSLVQRSTELSLFTKEDRQQHQENTTPEPSSSSSSSSPASPTPEILLMSLSHASHGLHIASANRIYIVTPIWQADVEAQAIKRAHRIGQTRPVYVETLVLRGTLEDQMLKRRREVVMLNGCSSGDGGGGGAAGGAGGANSSGNMLDDGGMRRVIEELSFLDMGHRDEGGRRRQQQQEEEEVVVGLENQIARLRVPRQLFGMSR